MKFSVTVSKILRIGSSFLCFAMNLLTIAVLPGPGTLAAAALSLDLFLLAFM